MKRGPRLLYTVEAENRVLFIRAEGSNKRV